MARSSTLVVKIISDATGAARGFAAAETRTAKFERRLGAATRVAKGTAVGLAAVGYAAFRQANALQQADGAVQSVFKGQANAVRAYGKQAADSLGLARSEYEQMAAVLGSQLKNMGTSQKALVPSTQNLIKLGGDLAATFGGKTSEAVEALSSLLRGERDPIERYGVSIKQADINARLAAKGQTKLKGAAKRAAETEATLALLYEQTAAAQGQRTREQNTAASQSERAMAKLKNAGASLGAILLPVVAAAADGLARMANYVEHNRTTFLGLVAVLGGISALVFAVNAAYKTYQATVLLVRGVTIAARNAQLAWNLAMMSNPIGLIVVAIAAVAAGMVLAYKRSATFRGIVQAVGRAGQAALGWIVSKARDVATWFGKLGPAANVAKRIAVAAFKAYTAPIRFLIGLIKDVVGWIGKIKFPKPPGWLKKAGGAIGGLFGGAPVVRAPSRLVSSPLTGRGAAGTSTSFLEFMAGGRGGGTIVNVTVNGALDPVAVGDQIALILARRDRRRGGRRR